MKNRIKITIILLSMVFISSPILSGDKKLAQTGCNFLLVNSIGRAVAMGEAFTAVEGASSSLYYNPAAMARFSGLFDVTANYNDWIADIKYNALSAAVSPKHGAYGVFGLTAMWVDYGDFQGTVVWPNSQGYLDTEIFSPKALSIGIGYAKSLSAQFSVGGQIKKIAWSLGNSVVPDENSSTGLSAKKNITSGVVFDFGTLYHTSFKSLAFGMSIRNFSREFKFEEESFELPLSFKMGISMDVFDFLPEVEKDHTLLVALDAVHPRSYPEYISIGCEYTFMKLLSLRTGYISGQDEFGLSYGFGIQIYGLAIDYAYTPFGVFDPVQRISVRISR